MMPYFTVDADASKAVGWPAVAGDAMSFATGA
jgi:hypothetical protein